MIHSFHISSFIYIPSLSYPSSKMKRRRIPRVAPDSATVSTTSTTLLVVRTIHDQNPVVGIRCRQIHSLLLRYCFCWNVNAPYSWMWMQRSVFLSFSKSVHLQPFRSFRQQLLVLLLLLLVSQQPITLVSASSSLVSLSPSVSSLSNVGTCLMVLQQYDSNSNYRITEMEYDWMQQQLCPTTANTKPTTTITTTSTLSTSTTTTTTTTTSSSTSTIDNIKNKNTNFYNVACTICQQFNWTTTTTNNNNNNTTTISVTTNITTPSSSFSARTNTSTGSILFPKREETEEDSMDATTTNVVDCCQHLFRPQALIKYEFAAQYSSTLCQTLQLNLCRKEKNDNTTTTTTTTIRLPSSSSSTTPPSNDDSTTINDDDNNNNNNANATDRSNNSITTTTDTNGPWIASTTGSSSGFGIGILLGLLIGIGMIIVYCIRQKRQQSQQQPPPAIKHPRLVGFVRYWCRSSSSTPTPLTTTTSNNSSHSDWNPTNCSLIKGSMMDLGFDPTYTNSEEEQEDDNDDDEKEEDDIESRIRNVYDIEDDDDDDDTTGGSSNSSNSIHWKNVADGSFPCCPLPPTTTSTPPPQQCQCHPSSTKTTSNDFLEEVEEDVLQHLPTVLSVMPVILESVCEIEESEPSVSSSCSCSSQSLVDYQHPSQCSSSSLLLSPPPSSPKDGRKE